MHLEQIMPILALASRSVLWLVIINAGLSFCSSNAACQNKQIA
jgi:hypothetical protein